MARSRDIQILGVNVTPILVGIFACFLPSADFFFIKIEVFKKIFQTTTCLILTLCMLGNFTCFGHLLIFFKINAFKSFFQEYHQGASLGSDQARPSVGPDVCKVYQQTAISGKALTN